MIQQTFTTLTLCTEEGHLRTQKVAIYKLGRNFSPATDPAGSWSGTFSLWRNRFLSFKLPSLWYFVIATWTDQDRLLIIEYQRLRKNSKELFICQRIVQSPKFSYPILSCTKVPDDWAEWWGRKSLSSFFHTYIFLPALDIHFNLIGVSCLHPQHSLK